MKKWFWLFWFLLAMCPMISFGQTIWDIDVSFCNSWIENDNYFTLVTEAGKTENVCVNIKNTSWKPVSLHIDFVDGAISDQWNSVCFAPDYLQKEFSKYISSFETDVDLQWGETVQKEYELQYPIWFSGLSHGCISYYINSDENNDGGVSMIFRKVNRIDVLVWWTEVSSRIKINDVNYAWNDYEHELLFDIENNWNIDQEVTITWFVEWWFNYRENFNLWSFVLKAGESVLVSANDIHLPDYRWHFHVNSYISNEPSVDFSIAHSNIYDNEYSVAGTVLVHISFFLWNRWFVALIVLVVALIWALIWRFSKGNKKSKK
jgi:hypothetical protein